ncbi:MAG TPA: phosphate acetyltransferase [Desulfobulbaceae bacterium]|nr:phosphate acetyltransferase [Desulfobulbaceae bacterium]
MAHNIFLAATETRSGKPALLPGMMEMLMSSLPKVGFFRPVINAIRPGWEDQSINLVLEHFELDISYDDAHGCTFKKAQELIQAGRRAELLDIIISKYNVVKARYDFVLCDGTNFRGQDPALEMELNTELAINLAAPMLLVISAKDKSTAEIGKQVQTAIETCLDNGADVLGCIINKAEETLSLASLRLKTDLPVFIIPERAELYLPTVADVKRWLGGTVICGEKKLRALVGNTVVAAMEVGNFLPKIKESSLIITPGDRNDIILGCVAAQQSSGYPDISGIVLTGGLLPHENVLNLLNGLAPESMPAIISLEKATAETIQKTSEIDSQLGVDDNQRIALASGDFRRSIDCDILKRRLITSKSTHMTPKMFEFMLLERAAKDVQRVVLAEGTCDRILCSASILQRRGVANIVLLGPEDEVKARARAFDVDLKWVEIIDPSHSVLTERFMAKYIELRQGKGVSEEVARERMRDVSYFGTMMVYEGLADAMVSGAENTTAHTIRPAFEFVKTKPGISVVSSVFLMCLHDRVLVYGDCAVNPNPDARQLAEIALSSAETARIFGIEPRVAMLSYSTGTSGKGQDVERIAEATKLAKQLIAEKELDLPLEGPLQYDAAVDPGVAATKMPNSAVAGKATVFIFPDLNTGNNTYKAVQRTAGAVAIGPILQGLKKPINDLSRGCTVDDIVNTVAITAIQAQAEKRAAL